MVAQGLSVPWLKVLCGALNNRHTINIAAAIHSITAMCAMSIAYLNHTTAAGAVEYDFRDKKR